MFDHQFQPSWWWKWNVTCIAYGSFHQVMESIISLGNGKYTTNVNEGKIQIVGAIFVCLPMKCWLSKIDDPD